MMRAIRIMIWAGLTREARVGIVSGTAFGKLTDYMSLCFPHRQSASCRAPFLDKHSEVMIAMT